MQLNLFPRRNGGSSRDSSDMPPLTGPKTLMAIMAHPDDIDFTSAGTIAKFVAEGWTVYYVLATSGDKGTHAGYSRQELAAMREQEQRDAAAALGVKDVFFFGYPDGWLQPTTELRGQIVKLLRQYKVDVVLTWDAFRPSFNHTDHRNIGIAARDAVFPAVRDHLYYEEHGVEGLGAHQVNEMLLAGADKPDYHVDVSGFLDQKVDAILAHRSQVSTHDRNELLKRWTDQSKRNGRRGYVESFKRVHIGRPGRQTTQVNQPQAQSELPAAVHEEEPAPAGASASNS